MKVLFGCTVGLVLGIVARSEPESCKKAFLELQASVSNNSGEDECYCASKKLANSFEFQCDDKFFFDNLRCTDKCQGHINAVLGNCSVGDTFTIDDGNEITWTGPGYLWAGDIDASNQGLCDWGYEPNACDIAESNFTKSLFYTCRSPGPCSKDCIHVMDKLFNDCATMKRACILCDNEGAMEAIDWTDKDFVLGMTFFLSPECKEYFKANVPGPSAASVTQYSSVLALLAAARLFF